MSILKVARAIADPNSKIDCRAPARTFDCTLWM
jgi:hypothetical protein